MNFKSNILKIGVVIALIFILIPVVAAQDVDESVSDAVNEEASVDEEVSIELADDSGTDSVEDSDDSDNIIDDGDEEVLNVDDASEVVDDEGTSDDASEDVENAEDVADDGETSVAEDNGHVNAAGDYDPDLEDYSADLQVTVTSNAKYAKIGDKVKFVIVAYNNGPDKATNVVVRYGLSSGNVMFYNVRATKGVYDSKKGIWYVGDMEPGEYQFLYLEGIVMTSEQVVLKANITSDTPDPDEENNVDVWVIDVEDEVLDYYSEPQTMHETANPIALAILALMSLAGVSLKRKF